MVFPSFPTRVCLKNTGPFDSNFIANDIIKNNGINAIIAIVDNATSVVLFTILYGMFFPNSSLYPFAGNFKNILEEYGVKKCIYGHLHGFAHTMVKEGLINNIEYVMVGCDYTGFKLIKL